MVGRAVRNHYYSTNTTIAKSHNVPQAFNSGYNWKIFKYLHFLMSARFVRFILPNLVSYYLPIFRLHVLFFRSTI